MTVGICALTEIENAVQLVSNTLRIKDQRFLVKEILVATPNYELATRLTRLSGQVTVLLEDQRRGKPAALNKILRHATSDVIVLASADIITTGDSIQSLVDGLLDDRSIGATDSYVQLVNGERSLMDRTSTLIWEIHNVALDELDKEGRLAHVAGDLLAFRRQLLNSVPILINDDAYIALVAHRKGLQVKRIRNATVWILGPRTPLDYFIQRSRVLLGHLQLVQRYGAIPTTFEFSLLRKPWTSAKILVRTIAKMGPSYIPPLFTGLLLEIVSFQSALVSLLSRRPFKPWKIARTTKPVQVTTKAALEHSPFSREGRPDH